jgi:OFA family oxalate/formate antiporter-like MFS transporter
MAESTKEQDKASQLQQARAEAAEIVASGKKEYGGFLGNRWIQLIAGFITIACVADFQYSWTLFSTLFMGDLGVSLALVQMAFTIFLVLESSCQFIGGMMIDRFGPRSIFILAAVLFGCGWGLLGKITNLVGLYVCAAMAGFAVAIVYGGTLSIATRWFPDRRGLANGVITAGYGMGALIFMPAINSFIAAGAYKTALLTTGSIQGILIFIMAFILRYPPAYTRMMRERNDARKRGEKLEVVLTEKDFTTSEALRTPQFWAIWVTFLSICVGGLIISAQTKPFGQSIGISASVISIAVACQLCGNGIGRPFWGWVSDHLGRFKVLGVVFAANAILLFLVPFVGQTPTGYVIITTLVMFTWGELYSLFPSLNADLFGTAYAPTTYGLLYACRVISAILSGGFAAWVGTTFGWNAVFAIAAAFSLFSAIMIPIIAHMPAPKHRVKRVISGTDEAEGK